MKKRITTACTCTLVCVSGGLLFAAMARSQQPARYGQSTAIDQAGSRAEQEAEQMVSLSADRILTILRREPGLLLQVKKALVRKAFEEGRILDPKDLTDDALFQIIRQDNNVRILATREIEDRAYIRAKPTQEELARNLPCRQPLPSGSEPVPSRSDDSQENAYWLKHSSDLDCYLAQYAPLGTAESGYWRSPESGTLQTPAGRRPQPFLQPQSPQFQSPQPSYPQQPTPPGSSPGERHPLALTETQPSQGYFGMEGEQNDVPSIQPSELPGLLNASQVESLSGMPTNGMGAGSVGNSALS